MSDPNRQRLLKRLGYSFRDEVHLDLALTHRSHGSPNNERMEFLGDSLLNMIVAEALYQQFPKAREGDLSRLRAQLVKGETLAEIGRELELGDCLRLGEGELKSGGYRRASILADAVEALVAAIYLDSADFQVCRKHLLNWYGARISEARLSKSRKDPKTQLQEWLQARAQPLPAYEVTKVSGEAHAQVFTVSCRVSFLSEPVVTSATTRRQAEKQAAAEVLTLLQARER
ncbi:ribonuclease III [Gilvimarinus sp. F26214L]|uniref:ribonuclease III n=1 Tax=Gilvimarinus sp. DZF01 TaxID=3461371 RepID=UPI0040451FB3